MMDSLTVRLLEIPDCQTADLLEMSDRLIRIVGMVRLLYYQTVRIVRIVGFSDCQLLDC